MVMDVASRKSISFDFSISLLPYMFELQDLGFSFSEYLQVFTAPHSEEEGPCRKLAHCH